MRVRVRLPILSEERVEDESSEDETGAQPLVHQKRVREQDHTAQHREELARRGHDRAHQWTESRYRHKDKVLEQIFILHVLFIYG